MPLPGILCCTWQLDAKSKLILDSTKTRKRFKQSLAVTGWDRIWKRTNRCMFTHKHIHKAFSPRVNLWVMSLPPLNSVAMGTAHICVRGSPIQLWKHILKLRANSLISENSWFCKIIQTKYKEETGSKKSEQEGLTYKQAWTITSLCLFLLFIPSN